MEVGLVFSESWERFVWWWLFANGVSPSWFSRRVWLVDAKTVVIGYILAGSSGAIVATVGMFLPAFFFVAISSPLIPHLRKSVWTKSFLDAVNVSAVALIIITTIQLGIATLIIPQAPYIDILGMAITLVAAVLTVYYRINAAWIVLGGALIGWGATLF